MKVTNDIARQVIQSYLDQVRRGKPGSEPAVELAPGEGDTLVLSDRARELAKAKAMVDKIPDIRKDKVDAIRERIALGLYDVDGRRIAEKLLGGNCSREA